MTIGKKIKELRTRQNMSVEELASKLGKNKATVYRYEKGDIENLPLDALEPLAKALHTTPSYLMGWSEDINNGSIAVYEFLKELRLRQHMTVEEFSKELGIEAEDLVKYESGIKYMSMDIIKSISDHYGAIINDETRVKRLKMWYENFNNIIFTDKEAEKIIEYTKFLIHIRKH